MNLVLAVLLMLASPEPGADVPPALPLGRSVAERLSEQERELNAELAVTEPKPGLTPAQEQARQDRRAEALARAAQSHRVSRREPPRTAERRALWQRLVDECPRARLAPLARLERASPPAGQLPAEERTAALAALDAVAALYPGSRIGQEAGLRAAALLVETDPRAALARFSAVPEWDPRREPWPGSAAGLGPVNPRWGARQAWLSQWASAVGQGLYRRGELEVLARHPELQGSSVARFVAARWPAEAGALRLWQQADALGDGEASPLLGELLRRYPRSSLAPWAAWRRLRALPGPGPTWRAAAAALVQRWPGSPAAIVSEGCLAEAEGRMELSATGQPRGRPPWPADEYLEGSGTADAIRRWHGALARRQWQETAGQLALVAPGAPWVRMVAAAGNVGRRWGRYPRFGWVAAGDALTEAVLARSAATPELLAALADLRSLRAAAELLQRYPQHPLTSRWLARQDQDSTADELALVVNGGGAAAERVLMDLVRRLELLPGRPYLPDVMYGADGGELPAPHGVAVARWAVQHAGQPVEALAWLVLSDEARRAGRLAESVQQAERAAAAGGPYHGLVERGMLAARSELVAVQATSPKPRWAVHVVDSAVAGPGAQLLLAGDVVVASAQHMERLGELTSVDRRTGVMRWRAAAAGWVAGDGERLYLARTDAVLAVDAGTGVVAWRQPLPWGRTPKAVAAGEGMVVVADRLGLLGFRVADGAAAWAVRAAGGMGMLRSGRLALVLSWSRGDVSDPQPARYALEAVDMATGRRAWRWEAPSIPMERRSDQSRDDELEQEPLRLMEPMVPWGAGRMVMPTGRGAVVLDVAAGRAVGTPTLRWQADSDVGIAPRGSVVVTSTLWPGELWLVHGAASPVGDWVVEGQRLVLRERATCRVLKRIWLPDEAAAVAADAEAVYVLTREGELLCYDAR